jgi:hypothetical protein
MQTFLPYPDFALSASCLDNKRLGKQRLEVYQILRVLLGGSKGWKHHPAVLQWAGTELQLIKYGLAVCSEWARRGFNDTLQEKISSLVCSEASLQPPVWLGDERYHASHRSNLLRKDPVWYGQFGWTEPNDLPYIWPVRITPD